MTTLRLGNAPTVRRSTAARDQEVAAIKKQPAPTIRLAHVDGAQGTCSLAGAKGQKKIPPSSAPALLVAYPYLKPWLARQREYTYRDWALDSGAFSAWQSGDVIDLQAYIEICKELKAKDPTLTDIFSLDVIGGAKAGVAHREAVRQSIRNAEAMWKAGVEAIPTFHLGEPEDALLHLAKSFPKIALGGLVRASHKVRMDWIRQCFARVWPKRIHGFGVASEEYLQSFPFHSVDATNWEMGPCAYGRWASFGGAHVSVRGSTQNLRSEVEHYLRMERQARERWVKEMAQLESVGPSLRLSVAGTVDGRADSVLSKPGAIPAVRLSLDAKKRVGERTSKATHPPRKLLGG